MTHEYNELEKKIRARVVANYLRSIGKPKCVCFSCGNASRELKLVGLDVIEVIRPPRWYSLAEIQLEYGVFDATSGHLPMPLMLDICNKLYLKLRSFPDVEYLPTGSGETFVCLKMAFPKSKIYAVRNLDEATEYNPQAPLNRLVEALA